MSFTLTSRAAILAMTALALATLPASAQAPLPGGGGVYVRWMSPYDPSSSKFIPGTPNAIKPTVLTGHQCIIGTPGYATSGCEHFGIATAGNPASTIYRWLLADPANPACSKPPPPRSPFRLPSGK